jgi:hypothetical protein
VVVLTAEPGLEQPMKRMLPSHPVQETAYLPKP